MTQWTDTARQTFERYCARARQSLAGSGADADEVIDDLRRHMDEEIRAAGLSVVTEEDIHRILNRIGETGIIAGMEKEQVPPPTPPAHSDAGPTPIKGGLGCFLFIIGVLLPVITLCFEFFTGASAGVLFDPMPTWFHTLLIALVPVVNIWMLRAARTQNKKSATLLGWLNGAAIGICLWYAILYLPITPFAAIGVIYFGLGLIPLSPALALLATPLIRASYRSSIGVQIQQLPGGLRGFTLAIVILIGLQMPMALTYYGLSRAASDDPAISRRGVSLLRSWGDNELMLRACYGLLNREMNMDLVGDITRGGHNISTDEARVAYYRATGQPFNSVPPPSLYTRSGRWTALDNEFTWDEGLGGEAVAGRVKGLSLQSSRLDANVEPEAATAYCEWTFEFRNVSPQQREARAQIALPPGGVVSRLTLWVNGEEREAAFAGRSQVREAYQQVAVRQRRDPVLVTTCGPDRVLMQCFPVPPNGGSMKVRVGITSPLVLDSAERGHFCWPKIMERNFKINDDLKHALWVESPFKLASETSALRAEHPKEKVFAVHGLLKEQELCASTNSIIVDRPADVISVWTPSSEPNSIIRETIKEGSPRVPSRLVFVIDGSSAMKQYAAEIADSLSDLPDAMEVAVLVAADETIPLSDKPQKNTKETRELLQRKLRSQRFAGGCDDLPALTDAWDMAAENGDGLVLWIHASQPMLISSVDHLRQRLERSAQSRVASLQVGPGPNLVIEKLDGLHGVDFVPRMGTLKSDLTRLFSTWSGKMKFFSITQEKVEAPTEPPTEKQASRHVERLWARNEAAKLASQHKLTESANLAAKHQLVTSLSGAVVLETAQQYADNKLNPADPTAVPTIPEPGTWALLMLGGSLLLFSKFCIWKRAGKSA